MRDKVYCNDCKHLHDYYGNRNTDCGVQVEVDTPFERTKDFLKPEIANMYNDCKHYEPLKRKKNDGHTSKVKGT